MEASLLPAASEKRDKKKALKSVDVVGAISEMPSQTQKIDPTTPAKAVKRKRSVLAKELSQDSSSCHSGLSAPVLEPEMPGLSAPVLEPELLTFSRVVSAGTMYDIKVQIVVLWYKNLYSQVRPKSITFVALDQEGALFEIVVSDTMSKKWAPRLEEGKVYIFKRLMSSENEKKLNVIETRFQLNVTKDTKCSKLNNECLNSEVMLPITKLNELSEVRPRENYLRHFVVYVIDVRPPSVRTQKKGDPSRFVEAYVVDETFTKTATVITIWDNIYEQHEDLFGHGFTKPFVLTVFGLKVKDFRGRFNLSASNFTNFYSGAAHNAHAARLHEWITTKLHLKMLDRRDLLHLDRLITLSEHAEVKTIRQVKAATPDKLSDGEILKFVVHGMILHIDIHNQIHYDVCDQCNRSPGDRSSSSSTCGTCGKSPVTVVPRFLLTMTIGDSQDIMKVTAFDRDAQEILYIQVEKALEIRDQKNGYDELEKLANQPVYSSYSFYLTLTDQSLRFLNRSGYKVQMLDWIPRRCISNSEIECFRLTTSDVPSTPPASAHAESDVSSGDSYIEVDSSSPSIATGSKSK